MVELLAGFVTIVFSYGIYSLISEENTNDSPAIDIDSNFIKKIVSFLLLFIIGIFALVIAGYYLS
ncbi:MAG TPA: hypothetical protein DCF84_03725 [Bacteroidetes bacterium]|nr:hypothetical protein [Bacteroidota bacterium]|tara:strand:- start:757 stop:951 length:195 start_codon:yes stop_codon:yes gene_type:complete